jgi:hypothetical protein
MDRSLPILEKKKRYVQVMLWIRSTAGAVFFSFGAHDHASQVLVDKNVEV